MKEMLPAMLAIALAGCVQTVPQTPRGGAGNGDPQRRPMDKR